MLSLSKTNSSNSDFIFLVQLLDQEGYSRYGEDYTFLAQFNKLDSIKHVVVAYKEGVAVGCGAIKTYTEGIAEIKRMFVHPDFRRLGIARSIMAALENWAKELGYTSCILETGFKQPEAIGLYKNMGYTVIPNYGQYAGYEGSVCMEKVLNYLQ